MQRRLMKTFIGFKEARELTLAHVGAGAAEVVPLLEATDHILAEDVASLVDSPSVSTSRKDGFAVLPEDLERASRDQPVRLRLVGSLSAGDACTARLHSGEAVRVTTGALIPEGAGSVLSEEFCRVEADAVFCHNTAEAGRNILGRGTDVAAGQAVARKGDRLTPPLLGLVAAAGHGTVRVIKLPLAAVIATGDEVVAPGEPLPDGKLYASNMVEIGAWLRRHAIPFETAIVGDRRDEIRRAVDSRLHRADIFITSGGAWGSERDLMLKVVEDMGWTGVYHRVRMGPGKPVGFGLLAGKPFFVLPGGPPSNEMAFLQLCLPALLKMKGEAAEVFPFVPAALSQTVTGQKGWTDFIHARVQRQGKKLLATPARLRSRLRSMAEKEALIVIPEEREEIGAGEATAVQLLKPMSDLLKGPS
jgi:molybdopterin molybdotransferase